MQEGTAKVWAGDGEQGGTSKRRKLENQVMVQEIRGDRGWKCGARGPWKMGDRGKGRGRGLRLGQCENMELLIDLVQKAMKKEMEHMKENIFQVVKKSEAWRRLGKARLARNGWIRTRPTARENLC